ncbi:MAG: CPBP family intramembrane glutamic endopeptidase [Dermatophilaceae bacterium]
MLRTTRDHARRHPVMTFLALALTFTWTFHIPLAVMYVAGVVDSVDDVLLPFIVGSFGPLVAALSTTALASGTTGMRAFVATMLRWRIAVRWYVVAVFLPFVIIVVAAMVAGQSPEDGWNEALVVLPLLGVNVVASLWTGPLGEEPGWRGFALPRLLHSRGPLSAVVLVGGMWTLWHAPVFVFPDWRGGIPLATFALVFLIDTILVSAVMLWLWWWTSGSVVLAVVYHAASNVSESFAMETFGLGPLERYSLNIAGYIVLITVLVLIRRFTHDAELAEREGRHGVSGGRVPES